MDKKETIEKFSKLENFGSKDALKNIPEEFRRYKCQKCLRIVDSDPCPNCGDAHLEIVCPLDHCNCHDEIIGRIDYCPICGGAVCPECGTHDVLQLSRVTGYLQDVSGWNDGKKQELKERKRYSVV